MKWFWFWFCYRGIQGDQGEETPILLDTLCPGQQGASEELVYRALTLDLRVGEDIYKSMVIAAPQVDMHVGLELCGSSQVQDRTPHSGFFFFQIVHSYIYPSTLLRKFSNLKNTGKNDTANTYISTYWMLSSYYFVKFALQASIHLYIN